MAGYMGAQEGLTSPSYREWQHIELIIKSYSPVETLVQLRSYRIHFRTLRLAAYLTGQLLPEAGVERFVTHGMMVRLASHIVS